MTAATTADLYLRLSDFRDDDEGSFPLREAALRAEAAGSAGPSTSRSSSRTTWPRTAAASQRARTSGSG